MATRARPWSADIFIALDLNKARPGSNDTQPANRARFLIPS